MKTKLLQIGISLLLLAVFVFMLPATNAYAACYASSCNAQDPYAHGCNNDAATAAYKEGTGVGGWKIGVYLRISTSCLANWTRTDPLAGTFWNMQAVIRENGPTQTEVGYQGAYSDMLDGTLYHCADGRGSYTPSSGWRVSAIGACK